MKVKKLGFLDKLDIYIMRQSFYLAVGRMKLPLAETVKTPNGSFQGEIRNSILGILSFELTVKKQVEMSIKLLV